MELLMRGLLMYKFSFNKIIYGSHTLLENLSFIMRVCKVDIYSNTVKPAHVITSIKKSPVFKVHLFLSCHRKFHIN
jgi:hypothetical protein